MKGKKPILIMVSLLIVCAMLVSACNSTNEHDDVLQDVNTPDVIDTNNVEENEDAGQAEEGAIDETGGDAGQDTGALNNRSVFFAHNSVGQNIIDGVRLIDGSIPILDEQQTGAVGIAEVYMGFNGDPNGKMDAFRGLMDNGGGNAQIAFFKLCYADFDANTNTAAMFDRYVGLLTELEAKYPLVTYVHVTAPLYHYNASYHNSSQHDFNERMRAGYGMYVFDLAAIEALDSKGAPAVSRDGVTPAMAEEWSLDGSHLNEEGGKYMAAELIAFLEGVPLKQ